MVSIEDTHPPLAGAPSILELFDELHESVPQYARDDLPSDGAKDYKRYLDGGPEDQAQ